MKGFFFFFESVGVPGGSPELGKGNSGWVPSRKLTNNMNNLKNIRTSNRKIDQAPNNSMVQCRI